MAKRMDGLNRPNANGTAGGGTNGGEILVPDACEKETVVNKSRFLGFCYPVSSQDEAEEKLAALRKKYYDATHVCFAYVTGTRLTGEPYVRQSDDGEPSGTAGAPILSAIRGAKVSDTLIALVRYFGGVKLGTGGLIRAYGAAAAELLARAKMRLYEKYAVYNVVMTAADYKKAEKLLLNLLGKSPSPSYNKDITFTAQLPLGREDAILSRITALTAGRAKAAYVKTEYVEKIKNDS